MGFFSTLKDAPVPLQAAVMQINGGKFPNSSPPPSAPTMVTAPARTSLPTPKPAPTTVNPLAAAADTNQRAKSLLGE